VNRNAAKPRVREVVVVEGRYDKNAVAQAVDALIVETRGFGVFSDPELIPRLRRLGEARGLIILTDGDGAGFLIRGRLGDALSGLDVKHAYVPDIKGRERRKTRDSGAGLLGVEGMSRGVILDALRRCGAVFESDADRGEMPPGEARAPVTTADLYELGLTGARDSAARRSRLAARLGLPGLIKTNALLRAVNILLSREEFFEAAKAAD
jgi:ribonuclease M5